jgi:hypothetical protein
MHKNKNFIRIHLLFLAFYGEDAVDIGTVCCWVRKSRDGGRNLDLNDQLLSGRPDTAAHDLSR